MLRRFDDTERRARLARRHHLAPGHRAPDVVTACDAVVALHATDPATVYLSVRARVDAMVVADLDHALYGERSLVRHLAMRRTLWVVPRDRFGVVQAAASQRVADQERRRLATDVEKAGIADDGAGWVEAAMPAALAALGERGEATSTELRATVAALSGTITYAPDKAYGGVAAVAPRVLTCLSAAGAVVRAGNRGGWTTSRPAWSPTATWLGSPPVVPAERPARAELVRRWLYAFGPATFDDLAWWSGSPKSAVRAALADVGAVEVDLEPGTGIALPDDLEPVGAVEPYAALLPALDPTTMGWQERGWYLGPHRSALFDRSGNAGPTAWWDGRVVGGWTQGAGGQVVLQLLEDVGTEALAALEAEAARLTGWLAGVRVAPRFPSPLSKEPSRS